MLGVPPSVKVFLYSQAADLRRGYDGLAAIVNPCKVNSPPSPPAPIDKRTGRSGSDLASADGKAARRGAGTAGQNRNATTQRASKRKGGAQ
jgi:hypothetical protein